MPLISVLLPLVGPVVLRALAAIGLGVVTYTGVDTVLSNLIDNAVNQWSTVSASMMAFASIAGVPKALGMITGAMTSRVGIWVSTAATRWIVKT